MCGRPCDHQFGALKGRSTTHALVDILHHWHKALDEGQSVRVLFVDYADGRRRRTVTLAARASRRRPTTDGRPRAARRGRRQRR